MFEAFCWSVVVLCGLTGVLVIGWVIHDERARKKKKNSSAPGRYPAGGNPNVPKGKKSMTEYYRDRGKIPERSSCWFF